MPRLRRVLAIDLSGALYASEYGWDDSFERLVALKGMIENSMAMKAALARSAGSAPAPWPWRSALVATITEQPVPPDAQQVP